MDSNKPFQPWADYFGLNQIVTSQNSGVAVNVSQEECNIWGFPICRIPMMINHQDSRFAPQETESLQRLDDSQLDTNTPPWNYTSEMMMMNRNQQDSRSPVLEPFHTEEPCLTTIHKKATTGKRYCAFCKANGEIDEVYLSHVLKDSLGRTTCPILRRYTCPLCGQSGDTAHTIKYCSLNTLGISTAPLKTSRTSAGRKRAC